MDHKPTQRLLLAAIAAATILACGCASEPTSSSDATTIAFPIAPGDVAWTEFQTHDEMVASTQLSDELLKLPTDQLLDICLNYPLLGDMLAYNNPSHGIEFLTMQFNGLRELLSRHDLGTVALTKYKSMRPEDVLSTSSSPDTPARVMTIAMFEIILARPEVVDTMTPDQQLELAALSSRNLRIKLEASSEDVFGSLSVDTAALLAARTIAKVEPSAIAQEEKAAPGLSEFLRGDGQLSDNILARILNHGSSAINTYQIKTIGGSQ